MKKLLLTGFEPFLDYTLNPTMKVVEELEGISIGEYQVIGKILPVDFSRAGRMILELIEEIEPDAVVSLGLAAGRFKMTPERIAINFKDGPVDNEAISQSMNRCNWAGKRDTCRLCLSVQWSHG